MADNLQNMEPIASLTVKPKILLAEDDKFISRAYKDGLTRAGYEVIAASDGIEAVAAAKKELPDLILLDVIMPLKNGFEALEEIRQDQLLKSIPVIFLSNLGQETDVKKGMELGAAGYLIKSNYSMQEVITKIKEIIDKRPL
jgi:two-component system, OmpR family, alkaline phosphatase synthesis response regulator PhoP